MNWNSIKYQGGARDSVLQLWVKLLENPGDPETQADLKFLGSENLAHLLRSARKLERESAAQISEIESMRTELSLIVESAAGGREKINELKKSVCFPYPRNLISNIPGLENEGCIEAQGFTFPIKYFALNPSDTTWVACSHCRFLKKDGEKSYCKWVPWTKRDFMCHGFVCEIPNLPRKNLKELFQLISDDLAEKKAIAEEKKAAIKVLVSLKKEAVQKPLLVGFRSANYFLPGDRVNIFSISSSFDEHLSRSTDENGLKWIFGTLLVSEKPVRDVYAQVFLDAPLIHHRDNPRPLISKWLWEGEVHSPYILHTWELNSLIKAKTDDPEYFSLWLATAGTKKAFSFHDPMTDWGMKWGLGELKNFADYFSRSEILRFRNPHLISAKEALSVLGLVHLPQSNKETVEAYESACVAKKHPDDVLLRARDMLLLRRTYISK